MQPRAHHSLKGKDSHSTAPVRGADPGDPQSSQPPPKPPRDTHIVWNGEFMGGGLGRGIQTCSETERGGPGEGAGQVVGAAPQSAASFRLPGRAPSRRGGHSRLGGYSEPRCSPALPPCSPSPLQFSPLCPLHHGGTVPEQGAGTGGLQPGPWLHSHSGSSFQRLWYPSSFSF